METVTLAFSGKTVKARITIPQNQLLQGFCALELLATNGKGLYKGLNREPAKDKQEVAGKPLAPIFNTSERATKKPSLIKRGFPKRFFLNMLSDNLLIHPVLDQFLMATGKKDFALRRLNTPLVTVVYGQKKLKTRLEEDPAIRTKVVKHICTKINIPGVETALIHVSSRMPEARKRAVADAVQTQLPPVPVTIVTTNSPDDNLLIEVLFFGQNVELAPRSPQGRV